MNKKIFGIVLDNPSQGKLDEIKAKWPNCYIHREFIIYISDEGSTLTEDIVKRAGIDSENRGFVFQIDYYSGYTFGSLVEWLQKNT